MSAPISTRLICHPACPCPILERLEVSASLEADGGLLLHYQLFGETDQLAISAPKIPGPADNLWQHTCCEAFIVGDGLAYREFNFSPSGQWAVYQFSAYRERTADFAPAEPPTVSFEQGRDACQLTACIPASLLPPDDCLHLGLTAVVEGRDGRKHYWAIVHAAAQPDFHLRQSLTLTLDRNTP